MKEAKYLSEIAIGETKNIVLLCRKIEEGKAKRGDTFVIITVNDLMVANRVPAVVSLFAFDKTLSDIKINQGALFSATVTAKEFKDGVSYRLIDYGPAPIEAMTEHYIPSAPWPGEKMRKTITNGLRKQFPASTAGENGSIQPDLVGIVEYVYETYKDKLDRYPASINGIYPVVGGLLWHTYSVTSKIGSDADEYHCDPELCKVGAALHDVGRILSMDADPFGDAEESVLGAMNGAEELGVRIVRDAAAAVGFTKTDEKVEVLCNMILAANVRSTVKPVTKEAELLQRRNMLDNAMNMFDMTEASMKIGEVSETVRELGHQVYRPSYRRQS